MSLFLRVGITEDERKELDKYLINHPFGKISHILRRAIRAFIEEERAKTVLAQKEVNLSNEKPIRKNLSSKRTL